jgi:hypothetical protein
MTPDEKRRRFNALAKAPHVETGREFEEHFGQLELDFSPKARKRVQTQPSKSKYACAE